MRNWLYCSMKHHLTAIYRGIMASNNNTSALSNVYVPDFQAWSNFYERRLKQGAKVGFGFQTEHEALEDREQLQQLAINQSERAPAYSKGGLCEQKTVTIVSPTEQTLLQAESVMRKSGANKTKKVKSQNQQHFEQQTTFGN